MTTLSARVHEDFDSVCALELDRQRALLSEGDAPERLWAAWSIALQESSTTPFAASLHTEPSPGVRAGLCTILAARGALEPLLVMAALDPASLVRSNACRLTCRLASATDERAHAVLRDRIVLDPSTDVRVSVIDELASDAPAATWMAVREALADEENLVRAAVVDRLIGKIQTDEEAFESLLRHAVREPVPDLRDRLLAAVLARAGTSVLATLAGARADVVVAALQVARARAIVPTSDFVATLVAREDPSISAELLAFEVAGAIRIDLGSMFDMAAAAYTEATARRWWAVGHVALPRALARLAGAETPTSDEVRRARALVARLDQWIERTREYAAAALDDDEPGDDWIVSELAWVERLRAYIGS